MNDLQITTQEGQYLLSLIKGNAGKIEALEKAQSKTSRTVRDMEEEYPLLPPEADDLSNVVRRVGCVALGGKNSEAYADKNLRKRVYQDIYLEVKREYGLINEMGRQLSYKKLKRKYLHGAIALVEGYIPPVALQNEIDSLNEIEDL